MLLPNTAAALWSQGQFVGLPATIPANGNVVSTTINTNGLYKGSVGLQSSQAGQLSVQLCVDAAGLVPLGPGASPAAVALVANTPNTVGWATTIPFGSIIITVTNTTGSVANLTNVAVNLAP